MGGWSTPQEKITSNELKNEKTFAYGPNRSGVNRGGILSRRDKSNFCKKTDTATGYLNDNTADYLNDHETSGVSNGPINSTLLNLQTKIPRLNVVFWFFKITQMPTYCV
ncbi:MAG: hypothetical protein Q7R69_00365 [bacterium]|nr:hypothetical protein [bacterium]